MHRNSPLVVIPVRRAVRAANAVLAQVARRRGSGPFTCPVCEHDGHFATWVQTTGRRRWARCVHCGSLERHRLQAWVIRDRLLGAFAPGTARVLHVAPEAAMTGLLAPWAGTYVTADYAAAGVDLRVDLRRLALSDASFDVVYASHVLEHVDDDDAALSEIARVLAPGGVAVLPVPLVGARTIEYDAPNTLEEDHVRAPGYDYFDRYRDHFAAVEVVDSSMAPPEIQPWIFEDRSTWPTAVAPRREASRGVYHRDAVPLCHKDVVPVVPDAGAPGPA